jgi:DNA-binding cell septation regulator SpoVG
MANLASNITTAQLDILSVAVEKYAPILEDVRSSQKGLKGRTGGLLRVVIPDSGSVVITENGLRDISSVTLNNAEFSKDLRITSANTAFSATALERVTNVDDFDKEIVQPRAVNYGETVNETIIDKAYTVAGIAQTAELATLDFNNLATTAGKLRENRATNLVGYMSPTVAAKLGSKGANGSFLPPAILEPMYKDSQIGRFANVQWKESKMPVLTVATANVMNDKWTIVTNGVDGTAGTITFDKGTGSEISASNVIKKGSVFTIAGVYAKDVLGKNTTNLKAFVVQEDATGDSTNKTITLKVGAFSNTGAHANVSAMPAATNTPTPVNCSAAKTYSVVFVFEKGNIEYDPVELNTAGFESVSVSGIDSKIKTTALVSGDINTLTAKYRIDSAFVTGGIDDRRAALLFVGI